MNAKGVKGRSVWPLAAMAMVAVSALVIAFGVTTRILSPSVVLDILALWPIGALAIPAWFVAWLKHSRKALGLPGLLMVTWLVASLGLHLSAWEFLPSATADVVGPDSGSVAMVDLSLSVPGRLELGPASGSALYRTGPLRIGGSAGVPEAFEQIVNGDLSLVLGERDDSGWFRFGGWWVLINPVARWKFDLSAEVVDVDLAAVDVTGLTVAAGSGRLTLGRPAEDVTVAVDGPIHISVPDGVPVLVVGPAVAPPGWSRLPDGWTSDGLGPAWRIEVVNSETAVEIVTR